MTNPAENRPVIEIGPSKGWRGLDLHEIFRYRELLFVLVWRDVKVRYRQTVLGVLWVVAQPLLTMAVFTVLFNRVARIPAESALPYPLFVMAALVPWTFFSTAVSSAGNSLIGNSHLISKVYFPRMIIPAAAVIGSLVDMAVTLAVALMMAVWYGAPLGPSLLFLPFITAIIAAFAFGCGLWLSSMNVRYRDVRVVVPFVLQLWMYATTVVYPASALPNEFRWIVIANPMTGLIEAFRASLLSDSIPWHSIAYPVLVTAMILLSGAFYFRHAERQFADVL